MTIPTFRDFIEPLLRHLAVHPEGVLSSEACEAVAAAKGLNDADRARLLPSGVQPIYKNRIGWAHDRLKRAALSQSPRRGFWRITPKGVELIAARPKGLGEEELNRLAYIRRAVKADAEPAESPASPHANQSPDERIQAALEELNDSVAEDLLEMIAAASPTFFEQLVLDLLHAMGYGTSRADLQRVGGSGDGGIDGIISLDRLGLEKVYVQAKRWQATVSRPEIQSFFGALAGRRAKKGVFITSSSFTREARDFAESVSDSIVLVDGDRLTSLMIEHGVGVTHKPLRVAQVDTDYFEDG